MPRRALALAALALLLAACGGDQSTKGPTNDTGQTTPSEPGPLAQELAAKKAAGMKQMPDEVKALIKKSGEEIAALDLASKAANVGAKAPGFALSDGNAEVHDLGAMLAKGPLVLTFYRGKW